MKDDRYAQGNIQQTGSREPNRCKITEGKPLISADRGGRTKLPFQLLILSVLAEMFGYNTSILPECTSLIEVR